MGPGAHDHMHHDEDPLDIRRRLVVAIVLGVPVVLISMVPALMFDGWQWVAGALATPVVFWCGWPYHRATWTNLRHGAVTMDTLVTVGTVAAWLWSVVALGVPRRRRPRACPRWRAREHRHGRTRLLRDRDRRHRAPAARQVLRDPRQAALVGRAAGAARARRPRRAARVGRGDPGRPAAGRTAVRGAAGREDRDRRRRGRGIVGGRRVDAHRRVGPGRGDDGRRRVRRHRERVRATRGGGDPSRERDRARPDRAARGRGAGLEGAGATARRPGLGDLRSRRARARARRRSRCGSSPATPPTRRSPPRSRC